MSDLETFEHAHTFSENFSEMLQSISSSYAPGVVEYVDPEV